MDKDLLIKCDIVYLQCKRKEIIPITDEFTNVSSFNLNKDKSKIVIIINSFIDKMPLMTNLYSL